MIIGILNDYSDTSPIRFVKCLVGIIRRHLYARRPPPTPPRPPAPPPRPPRAALNALLYIRDVNNPPQPARRAPRDRATARPRHRATATGRLNEDCIFGNRVAENGFCR
ncbi:hypothetical protein O0L34_g1018 [Tuta absoluta]|nr:hypothetical protein O0L34_g1018 [Tuta absoluta]